MLRFRRKDAALGEGAPDSTGFLFIMNRLAYTGLLGGVEHLKIKTRLINEKIKNTLSEYNRVCDLYVIGDPSKLNFSFE